MSSQAPRPITGHTRLAAVLGWPVGHSRSPAIHNAAFAADGIDAVYVALATPPEDLATVIGGLAAVNAIGANVTVPHKVAVTALCDTLSVEAQAVGAVNTVTFTEGRVEGHNTDTHGVTHVLVKDLEVSSGVHCLLVGAGGAARAAAVALGRLSANVVVSARRVEAAEEVAALVASNGGQATGVSDTPDVVASAVRGAELVINATPIGMNNDAPQVGLLDLRSNQRFLDMVYREGGTPWQHAAEAAGTRVVDGLGMLVAQAGGSYSRWTGNPAPLDAMYRAVQTNRV